MFVNFNVWSFTRPKKESEYKAKESEYKQYTHNYLILFKYFMFVLEFVKFNIYVTRRFSCCAFNKAALKVD